MHRRPAESHPAQARLRRRDGLSQSHLSAQGGHGGNRGRASKSGEASRRPARQDQGDQAEARRAAAIVHLITSSYSASAREGRPSGRPFFSGGGRRATRRRTARRERPFGVNWGMPSPGNVPLSFNRDRIERQLDARFEELLAKLRKNRPAEDPWIVRRGYEIATERHRDQSRISGDPYLTHLLEVAHILADLRLDATTLTAALLHDVIADTEFPLSRIEERFGADVAHLVEGVTKIGRLNMMAPEARQAENVRKMLLAMVNDVRVVLVKLADRLHNLRTLEYLEPAKQQRISRETLDIYAPIAHRLRMRVIRGELQNLAFRYLEPESFFALQKEITH